MRLAALLVAGGTVFGQGAAAQTQTTQDNANSEAQEELLAEEAEGELLADTLNTEEYVIIERRDYDFVPDASYDEIEARVACMNSEIQVPFNTRVKAFIDYFTIKDREYARTMLRRQEVYFPLFEKYLAKHNMPEDLKYLSIVESGLNPRAMSRVGAAGLWQFMPATGRIYRLNRNWFVDERLDPEKATEAACRYLKQLHAMFDDWQLALAAYNAGPGNVRKAIRRSGYKKDFWEVYNHLPRETRAYVPQFAAVMYVMQHADEHNLRPADHELLYALHTDTITVNNFMSLAALEKELNLCEGELEALNPELVKKAVPENAGSYALIVPSQVKHSYTSNKETILANTAETNNQMIAFYKKDEVGSTYNRERVSYRVQRGDYLGKIASRYGVRVEDIKQWNRLRSNNLQIGQRLAIYVKAEQKSSINTQLASAGGASAGSASAKVSGSKVYYVQPGDTLWEISKKHGNVSVDQIKRLNNLRGSQIKVGQKLVLAK
jgi:membrane-bound lytic murein transglycosylase D